MFTAPLVDLLVMSAFAKVYPNVYTSAVGAELDSFALQPTASSSHPTRYRNGDRDLPRIRLGLPPTTVIRSSINHYYHQWHTHPLGMSSAKKEVPTHKLADKGAPRSSTLAADEPRAQYDNFLHRAKRQKIRTHVKENEWGGFC